MNTVLLAGVPLCRIGIQRRFNPVKPGIFAFDNIRGGFAGAKGFNELALYSGDGAIEYSFGFGAERAQGVVPQGFIIEAGFLLVDAAEFLPICREAIGVNPLRVSEK